MVYIQFHGSGNRFRGLMTVPVPTPDLTSVMRPVTTARRYEVARINRGINRLKLNCGGNFVSSTEGCNENGRFTRKRPIALPNGALRSTALHRHAGRTDYNIIRIESAFI